MVDEPCCGDEVEHRTYAAWLPALELPRPGVLEGALEGPLEITTPDGKDGI